MPLQYYIMYLLFPIIIVFHLLYDNNYVFTAEIHHVLEILNVIKNIFNY